MEEVVLACLEECGGIVVNGDGSDFIADAVEFAALFAGVVFAGDFFHDIHAVGDLAEDRVAVVQEGGGGGGDEKLRAIGAWASIGHGEYARRAVAQLGVEFIGKLVTGTATAAFGGIAALQHEALDDAMEGDVVIISAAGEIEEIRAGQRGFGGVERGIDVAGAAVKGDFDVGHGREETLDRALWQSRVREHPLVFAGDLFADRALQRGWQDAPRVGFDFVVLARLRVASVPGEHFGYMAARRTQGWGGLGI